MTGSIQKMEQKCRLKGVKLTHQRRLIIAAIADAPAHLTVEDLYQHSTKKSSKISLATVYRTIKMLEKNEIIERHLFFNGSRSLIEEAKRHHDHFIDVNSGEITEFRSEAIERLQQKVAAQNGFEIVHHRLEIYVKPLAAKTRTNTHTKAGASAKPPKRRTVRRNATSSQRSSR